VFSLPEEARWYVVHTYSGYENKVASNLEKTVENRQLHDLIQQVLVPTETVTEVKDDKQREVERKVFPGYVLVKMILTDESWYVVRNIRGCTGFVGPSSKPIPLTEEEVARLGVDKHEVEVLYKTGDSVKIIAGPLKALWASWKPSTRSRTACASLFPCSGAKRPSSLSSARQKRLSDFR
jgi:transcriptional antiterminator NusG